MKYNEQQRADGRATRDWALYYAGMGWKVFPLSPNTNVPIEGSNGHHDATDEFGQIEEWWTDMPTANVGIATGAVSGIWVLDLDIKNDKNGPQQLRVFLEQRDASQLPVTRRARSSSGGAHVFFRYDAKRPVKNRADILPGIDVRGDGGYICAAPSVRDGGLYKWADDAYGTAVIDAPEWAYQLVDYDSRSPTGKRSDRPNKVDRSLKLPWDMPLGARHSNGLLISQTEIGRKYICRCPFHDDRSASAAFWRKTGTHGVLFCSACDTSWVTEKKRLPADEATVINNKLAQLRQQLKDME